MGVGTWAGGHLESPLSTLVPPVLQEAVSTGDPEMVQLVLQYRDYQRATQRLAGIPELLHKLRQVQQGRELWPVAGVVSWRGNPGHPCQAWPWKGTQSVPHAFPMLSVRCLSFDPGPGSPWKEASRRTRMRASPLGGRPLPA